MRVALLLMAIAALGCDRAPAPPASSSEASPASPGAPPLEGEHASGALPPGHPPTGALPPGHPPTTSGGMPSAGNPVPFDPADPVLAGVRWEIAAPFAYRAPTSSMRAAEYAVGGDASAVMSVFHFPGMGGSVESNVERWVEQLAQPDGRPSREVAEVRRVTSNGLPVTVVDVTGNFVGGMGAPPASGQRLLGAIVEGPAGPVFFKLLGPAAVVGTAEPAFDAFVASLAPAG